MRLFHHEKITRVGVMLGVAFILMTVPLFGQNPFEDAIKQLSSDNVRGYLQPFSDGFGANLNSGMFRTAAIPEGGFHFEFRIIGMGTLIGDAEKTYFAVPPEPFDQTPVQTATVFGGQGAIVYDDPLNPTVQYKFQNGQVKTSIVPLAMPQISLGGFFGTQLTIRYVPIPEIGDFPKVTLWGVGARHSISRYIPNAPLDVAAGFFYQKLDVGDVIDASAFSFGAEASKSFSVLTLYGGLQIETSTTNVKYTYTGPVPVGSPPNPSVSLDLKGENTFRFIGGLGLDLAILHLNADINIGKVTVVSTGIGLGL